MEANTKASEILKNEKRWDNLVESWKQENVYDNGESVKLTFIDWLKLKFISPESYAESLSQTIHAKSVSDSEIRSEIYDLIAPVCFSGYLDSRVKSNELIDLIAKWMQDRLTQTTEREEEVIYFCKRTMGRDNPIPHCMDWCGDETCRLYTNDQKKEKEEKTQLGDFFKKSK